MIFDKNVAKKTAELLLQINAIKLQPQNPFTWASGWKSPIYCDNRITLSYPEVRNYIREQMANHIENQYGKPDVIAGVATGAIGIGALVAECMHLPFIYVRPKPKEHGRQNQIEGLSPKGKKVVVIEDLISTGGSSLQAVEALRKTDAQIKGMVAIFTYGFDVARTNFESAEIPVHTLSDYPSLLEQARDTNYITESDASVLQKWREQPDAWNSISK